MTATDEQVERVARALWDSEWSTWPQGYTANRETLHIRARAAIAALQPQGEQVERVRTAQKWAEGLISQLPDTHDGRNSWLLNYGAGEEAEKIRAKWNREADQRHAPPSAKYHDLAALPQQGDGLPELRALSAEAAPGMWKAEQWGDGSSHADSLNVVAPDSEVVLAADMFKGDAAFIVACVNHVRAEIERTKG